MSCAVKALRNPAELAEELKRMNGGEMVDLSRERLGKENFQVLADDLLPLLPNLRRLFLILTGLGSDGLDMLVTRGLQHCPNLVALNICHNEIDDGGIELLVDYGLQHLPKLVRLTLNHNRIGNVGVGALVDRGLQHLPNLESLDLGYNRIGDEGVEAFAIRGLQRCPRLVGLFLLGNGYGRLGEAKFAAAIAKDPPPALEFCLGVDLHAYASDWNLPESLHYNQDILSFLREHPTDLLRRLSSSAEHEKNKDVMLAAVKQSGRAMRYASPVLKADRDVVLHAVESAGNRPLPSETEIDMWEKLESYADAELVQQMRSWCREKYGVQAEAAMMFHEVHAQFVSFPKGVEEDPTRFPDLGWMFLRTLETLNEHSDVETDEDTEQEKRGG